VHTSRSHEHASRTCLAFLLATNPGQAALGNRGSLSASSEVFLATSSNAVRPGSALMHTEEFRSEA
jgi:hypothetical protein